MRPAPAALHRDGAADDHHRQPEHRGHHVAGGEVDPAEWPGRRRPRVPSRGSSTRSTAWSACPPTPPIRATVHPRPSPPASGMVGTSIPRATAPQSSHRRTAVTTTVTNMTPMQRLITFSKSRKPPARTSPRPEEARGDPEDDLAGGGVGEHRHDGVDRHAARAHERRAHEEAPEEEVEAEDVATGRPRRRSAPSRSVSPVASCHRARPSVIRYFRKAPRSTAHSTATPSRLAVKAAVARSPAPTPVAATRRPGLMSARAAGPRRTSAVGPRTSQDTAAAAATARTPRTTAPTRAMIRFPPRVAPSAGLGGVAQETARASRTGLARLQRLLERSAAVPPQPCGL